MRILDPIGYLRIFFVERPFRCLHRITASPTGFHLHHCQDQIHIIFHAFQLGDLGHIGTIIFDRGTEIVFGRLIPISHTTAKEHQKHHHDNDKGKEKEKELLNRLHSGGSPLPAAVYPLPVLLKPHVLLAHPVRLSVRSLVLLRRHPFLQAHCLDHPAAA